MGYTNKTRHFFWENKHTADSDTTVKTQPFFLQDTACLGQSACSSSADGDVLLELLPNTTVFTLTFAQPRMSLVVLLSFQVATVICDQGGNASPAKDWGLGCYPISCSLDY